MLVLPLALVLPLPPLAFGPALPEGHRPPRELTCPVAELTAPPPSRPFRLPVARPALDAAALRPAPPARLVGPVTDGFLFLGLTLLSHATGGTVTPDAWPGDRPWIAQRK
jgi:hypothetical protein